MCLLNKGINWVQYMFDRNLAITFKNISFQSVRLWIFEIQKNKINISSNLMKYIIETYLWYLAITIYFFIIPADVNIKTKKLLITLHVSAISATKKESVTTLYEWKKKIF